MTKKWVKNDQKAFFEFFRDRIENLKSSSVLEFSPLQSVFFKFVKALALTAPLLQLSAPKTVYIPF